ncbi:hypothetical protein JXA40_00020 [bacterium]|nr:hypothetical protein [candidate division CSSED10-310 bacterium]
MGLSKQMTGYFENVIRFLQLDLNNTADLIEKVIAVEPENRVVFDREADGFRLGMAVWPTSRITKSLKEIQSAIRDALDSAAEQGKIDGPALERLNTVSHDLKIQHFPAPDTTSGMQLGYQVPDSKIAWEEGKCPHCGETVTIHLFPDPIPILAYEAIINTLRLLTRHAPIRKTASGYNLE